MKSVYILTIISLGSSAAHAEEAPTPAPLGNFALHGSQQPGTLLSIGQNIYDAGQFQISFLADDYVGNDIYNTDLVFNGVYGITDQFSVLLSIPFAPRYKLQDFHSSGLEDFSLQFEYAYYTHQRTNFTEQGTVLANITFPTGSDEKTPPTGLGTVSFLLGTTYNRAYRYWYMFVSPGAIIVTAHNGTRYGNKYLYQCGLGRVIDFRSKKWISAWLIEVDGQYSQKNLIDFQKDPNSGGNVVYITPSLWFSDNHLILQAGIGKACAQHLFGTQPLNNYLVAGNVRWLF